MTEPPGLKPPVVNVVVVGLFEEEEQGTGVASDVVKVEGEDPDTPGYQRGDRVRLGRRRSWIVGASPLLAHDEAPGQYITIPQYWFNKTKQHTLSVERRRAQSGGICSVSSRRVRRMVRSSDEVLDSMDLPLDGIRLAPAETTAQKTFGSPASKQNPSTRQAGAGFRCYVVTGSDWGTSQV